MNEENLPQRFRDTHSTKSGPLWIQIWQTSPNGANDHVVAGVHNSIEHQTEKIYPVVSDICILLSLDQPPAWPPAPLKRDDITLPAGRAER